MERPHHRVELHDPRGALERVEATEDAVDPFAFVGPLFQRQQVRGGLFDKLAAFRQELLEELVHDAGSQSSPA